MPGQGGMAPPPNQGQPISLSGDVRSLPGGMQPDQDPSGRQNADGESFEERKRKLLAMLAQRAGRGAGGRGFGGPGGPAVRGPGALPPGFLAAMQRAMGNHPQEALFPGPADMGVGGRPQALAGAALAALPPPQTMQRGLPMPSFGPTSPQSIPLPGPQTPQAMPSFMPPPAQFQPNPFINPQMFQGGSFGMF